MKKFKSTIDETNERNAKAAADATRDAVTATKDATDALIKFPTTRIIEGKERCLLAPNGSPDCNAAAEKICKGKGFASGKSADIESSRKCSARALLSRSEADCVNETTVDPRRVSVNVASLLSATDARLRSDNLSCDKLR